MKYRVLIMANGQQSRLPTLTRRKHLLPLVQCNATILERTVGMIFDLVAPAEVVVVAPEAVVAPLADAHGDGTWKIWEFPDLGFVSFQIRGGRALQVLDRRAFGSSLLRELATLEKVFEEPCGDDEYNGDYRMVVLLGDVVYSRACLKALLESTRPMEWAVTPSLTPATGEVFGFSFPRITTPEFLACLRESCAKPAAFQGEQPGTCRKLLWAWQAAKNLQGWGLPSKAACTFITDYTDDIDTPEDLMRLMEIDHAAYLDDHGLAPGGDR